MSGLELSKNFIKKVLDDDKSDNIISDTPVTNIKKKGYYWLITIYDDKKGDFSVEGCMKKIKNGVKHVKSLVGQMEMGEVSKERHIHISITFEISSAVPLTSLNKLFPESYICNSSKPGLYDSYCSKKFTRISGNSPVLYNIKKGDIEKFDRVEFSSDVEEKDDERDDKIKKLEEKIAYLEKKVKELINVYDGNINNLDKTINDASKAMKKVIKLERDNVIIKKKLHIKVVEEDSESESDEEVVSVMKPSPRFGDK
jgi:hypothetical protein